MSPKQKSPAFNSVVDRFEAAMRADGKLDDDLIERLLSSINSNAVFNPARAQQALFPVEKTGGEQP